MRRPRAGASGSQLEAPDRVRTGRRCRLRHPASAGFVVSARGFSLGRPDFKPLRVHAAAAAPASAAAPVRGRWAACRSAPPKILSAARVTLRATATARPAGCALTSPASGAAARQRAARPPARSPRAHGGGAAGPSRPDAEAHSMMRSPATVVAGLLGGQDVKRMQTFNQFPNGLSIEREARGVGEGRINDVPPPRSVAINGAWTGGRPAAMTRPPAAPTRRRAPALRVRCHRRPLCPADQRLPVEAHRRPAVYRHAPARRDDGAAGSIAEAALAPRPRWAPATAAPAAPAPISLSVSRRESFAGIEVSSSLRRPGPKDRRNRTSAEGVAVDRARGRGAGRGGWT